MNSLGIAAVAFVCSMGGGLVGLLLRRRLPESHLDEDTKEVVKLGTGLVGTMAALVLGLLVASATGAFDAEDGRIQQLATDFVLLDRGLAHYGPEASVARARLRVTLTTMLDRLQVAGGSRVPAQGVEVSTTGGAMFDAIRDLVPKNDAQRMIQSQAIQTCAELAKTRLALDHGADNPIPTPFLVVLMCWLAILFVGFGLLARRNATVVVVIVLCALSVSAALFLILDLDQPFEGLIRIDDDALREALSQIGR